MSWTTVDPLITVVAFHGPLTQLAARLGIEPRAITRAAIRRHGRLELEVTSPVTLQTLKRQIQPPEPD